MKTSFYSNLAQSPFDNQPVSRHFNQPHQSIFDHSRIQKQQQQQGQQQLQDPTTFLSPRHPHANSPLLKQEQIGFVQSATPAGMRTLIDNKQTSTLAAHGSAQSQPHKQSGHDSNLEMQIGL